MDGPTMTLCVLSVAFPFAPVGPDSAGGAEQILWLLDRGLCERGDRSEVIACQGSQTHGRLHALPIPDHPWSDSKKRQVHRLCREEISRLMHELQPDILHLHGIDFVEYLPQHTGQTRVVVSLHLPPGWYPDGALVRSNAELVCVSRSEATALEGQVPVHVIPNGIDTDTLSHSDTREPWTLVLGRICPEKGYHHAIDAARIAGVPLKIAGRVFPYESHIRYFGDQVAPRLGRGAEYLGAVGLQRKRELLASARCLLIPSLVDETSSLVAMEAAASGCPVVAFRRGALPEVVEQGVTGFIVDDVESMARAITQTFRLHAGRMRARAVERFGYRTMVEAYRALYLGGGR